MGKKSKTGKARKDRFYYLAKETGYRSRAAFKLIQLNRRFNFLNSSKVLIDLCAAPGGWLQVASKEMPVASQIIGVDLVPIQPIPRVKTIIADITTERCKQLIHQELLQNKVDVVLHDGAPNVGTAWCIDEFSQANLCLQAFSLATEVLRKGGWFITKIFRSRDYEPFKWVLTQFFRTVRAIKPEASRLESAEIFLVGQFYLSPDRIDNRFLDCRHVFGEIEATNRDAVVSSFLKASKGKRKAEGYMEGDTLYHELLVSDFLHSSDPLESLAKTNKITFDLPEVDNHPLTTDALKTDLLDIQVLGKADIKNILKWRNKILIALELGAGCYAVASEPKPNEGGSQEGSIEGNADLKVEEEVQRLLQKESREQKKRLRRVRKAKIKAAERLVLKMDHPGDHIEQEDAELFSLATLHDLVGLEKASRLIGDTSLTASDALVLAEEAAALRVIREKSEAERRSAVEGYERVYFQRRGDAIDVRQYENYETSDLLRDRNDLYLSSEDESDIDGDTADANVGVSKPDNITVRDNHLVKSTDENTGSVTKRLRSTKSKQLAFPTLDEFSHHRSNKNPLLVDLDDVDTETADKQKIQSWLESNSMKNLLAPVDKDVCSDDLSDSDTNATLDHNQTTDSKRKQRKKDDKPKQEHSTHNTTDPNSFVFVHGISLANELPGGPGSRQPPVQGLKRLRRPLSAEERALAVRLIRSAKSRRELIESGYHRMQFFEDYCDLPDWFVEDERKHMRKPLPLTKEEVITDGPTMGRTINKVEEARARKRSRLAKRLKLIRQKVEDISDDVPETEKWQQIKQIYKKAGLLGKKRRPLHVVVNTKAGARNSRAQIPKGAKIKIVDRRMKADLRGQRHGTGKGRKRGGARGSGKPVRLLSHKPRRRGNTRR